MALPGSTRIPYAFKKFNTGDGLQGLEFESNAFLKTRNGEMFFGGINGFNCFYPGSIRANPFIPPVYITGFQLSNRKVSANEEGSPLEKDISLVREVQALLPAIYLFLHFCRLELYHRPKTISMPISWKVWIRDGIM